MRWSIVRIIWARELRDQLRDRRTLFMVAGLPLLLYPILGIAVLKFAAGFVDRKTTIGIVAGSDKARDFPPRRWTAHQARTAATWLALTPTLDDPLARVAGTAALAEASRSAGPDVTGLSPMPPLSWLTVAPLPGGVGVERVAGAAALAEYSR